MTAGRLIGLGVGPGAPDLLTLRAARHLATARQIAFFRKAGRPGQARRIVADLIPAGATEWPMDYPVTTEAALASTAYERALSDFYDTWAGRLEALLAADDVTVLCEGDPLFYGSFMHLLVRLRGRVPVDVVPGLTGMSACWTAAGLPMTWGDDALLVLPGTLPPAELERRMAAAEALVIMKVGRHLAEVRAALRRAGRLETAILVEAGSMPEERVRPLAEVADSTVPYFSIILVPGRGRRPGGVGL